MADKMTDLEIIKMVAEWCELDYQTDEEKIFRTSQQGMVTIYEGRFDPLNSWQDCMEIVVPRLPEKYVICICGGTFDLYDSEHRSPVPMRGDLTDLRSIVCKLAVEIAQGGKGNEI